MPVGVQLLPCITSAFDAIEHGIRQVASTEQREKLLLAVPPTLAAQWLSPRLESLTSELPGVDLSIRTSMEGNEHCIVHFDRQPPPDSQAQLLWMEQHILVGAPNRIGQSLQNLLARLPTMHVMHNDSRLELWPEWPFRAGLVDQGTVGTMEFSTLEQAIHARAQRRRAGHCRLQHDRRGASRWATGDHLAG
jgi:LysR family glycine cleavage system transcriptional activator